MTPPAVCWHLFARGNTADKQAVAAAIVDPWSNGRPEGHIDMNDPVRHELQVQVGVKSPPWRQDLVVDHAVSS
jgi:hypothetical protein